MGSRKPRVGSRRRLGFLLCLASAGLAASAAAQETSGRETAGTPAPAVVQAAQTGQATPTAGSDEDRQEARHHYRAGQRLLERSRVDEALEEFAAAYVLYPHWATSNNMGVCHDRLGRPTEALRLYEQALREGGDEIPERQRSEIGDRVDSLRIQLGVQEPTTGTIRVSTAPSGAAVRLDGNDVGVTPLDLDVPPGPHRIDVVLEGYQPNGVDMTVTVGQAALVALVLEAVPAVVATGRLVCVSEPGGARVLVDGTEIGLAPVAVPVLPAGEHVVRFELDDGRVLEDTVSVRANGTARVSVAFGSGADPGWFWGLTGTALALGAGAAATGAYGTVLWNEFNDPGTGRSRQEEIQPTGRTMMLTTDVLAGAAGACAFAALVLAFVTDWGGEAGRIDVGYESPPEPAVVPDASPP